MAFRLGYFSIFKRRERYERKRIERQENNNGDLNVPTLFQVKEEKSEIRRKCTRFFSLVDNLFLIAPLWKLSIYCLVLLI